MRPSRLISAAVALAFAGAAALAGAPPARVVSLNACTDQLALLVAAPGQLVSVSRLAHDPRVSALAGRARTVPANDGSAEAVVRLRPDLVLAGSYTTRATTDLLDRLGYRVERFAPATSLEDVRGRLRRMGALLGREDAARHLLDALDAGLAEGAPTLGAPGPRVALYHALGNSSGPDTLAGDLLEAAGMANVAAELGLRLSGPLPLERLVLADPDMVLVTRGYGGHARATEVLTHPALRRTGALRVIETGPAWSCGTPLVLDAVAELRALRAAWEAAR